MNTHTKYLLSLLVVFTFISIAATPPIYVNYSGPVNQEQWKQDLIEYMDAWQLVDPEKRTQQVDDVSWQIGYNWQQKKLASMDVDFGYLDTFNFTNSNNTFGNFVMTSEEVNSNLRNYIHQLLYNDIELACEVSVLDIMLFRAFDSLIIDWIDMSFAGFCNGFAQASRDFYNDPELIPLGIDHTYNLPSPNPNETISQQTGGDVVEAVIKEYVLWKGSGAFFNPNHLLNWIKIYLGIPTPQGGITNAQELEKVQSAMMVGTPHYTPAVILLMAPIWEVPEPTESHFVTAYDYDVNPNGSTTLYVYNNNDRYTGPDNMYTDWILIDSNGNFKGTKLHPDANYSRIAFYPDTGEYNNILTALMDLLPKLLGVGVFSPVDVEITDPIGRSIRIDDEGNQYHEYPALMVNDDGEKQILMPFVQGLPYTINLTGNDVGDFRLETNRFNGEELLTNEINGTTEPDKKDVYTVTLRDEGIDIVDTGVYLQEAMILSGSSVELEWSQFDNEATFEAYEIYISKSPDKLGQKYGESITDIAQTSSVITGLTPETTYFFTVKTITNDNTTYQSNRVGAAMPEDITFWIYLIVGIAGISVVILALVLYRRRE
ncbi:MAG: hypothetical protein GF411_04135 [Candidatus Lokiarchaeota archaeon]|nr:hypothetical protein [Candidatus Lokiarchaeota archaeon]